MTALVVSMVLVAVLSMAADAIVDWVKGGKHDA